MHAELSIKNAIRFRNASLEEIQEKQVDLLRKHIRQASKSPYYKNLFKEAGLNPEDINTIADIGNLPLTSRADLDKDPAAFVAVSRASMADLALTSGTTGDSVLVPYTTKDLDRLAFNECMCFWGTGARPGDRYLVCVTLDRCFIAGLAYYTGLVKLGATTIRSGPGQPARQWEMIRKLNPTGIVGVPSFLLRIATWMQENGHDPKEAGIKSLVTIGEPIRKADHSLTPLGRELENGWGAQIFSSYGATELETAFCECTATCGGHVHPELMLVEIIDDQGNILPAGEPGEVVVTPLGVEGFPLVRFRTGDIARLHTEPCTCGWQTPRLGTIEGRLAQRLKFRGTTLYPEMIFHTLQELPEVQAVYIDVHSAFDLSDEVTVVIGTDEPANENVIAEHLQARLRVVPEIVLKDRAEVVETMEKAGGHKLKKFFDYRKENKK